MDEALRILRLEELALDTIKQREVFGRIAILAAETLDCPVAAISVIEKDREWFLGQTGLPFSEFGRVPALGDACLDSGQPLLIDDARRDPRLARNALVRPPLRQRSYIGVPITIEDETRIGALWCASPDPAAFDEGDLAQLSSLGQLAEQCLNAHKKTIELARANTSLRQLNKLFKQAETAAQIGSWRVDIKTNELHWSDQVFAIHGIPVGSPPSVDSAIHYYEPADRPLVEETLARVLEDGQPFSFEATIRREDGQLRRIRAMGERIDADGEPECLAGVFLDCTEEHLQTIALQRAATRDALTGLCNRSEFDRRLVASLEQRSSAGPGCPLTVMLIDLDGFKDVNDRLGHLVGDRLLVQLAKALESSLPDGAFIARWGGDEFALLFAPGVAIDEAIGSAQTIIAHLSKPIQLAGNSVYVSATCGLSEMREGATGEELMRRADLALYHGKTNGRGSAYGWDAQIEAAQGTRKAAIEQLSNALDTGRAFAAYQPIVRLEDDQVTSVEALLRLRDPSGAQISASEFFPALCDPNLARRVSRFMLDRIAAEAPAILELFGPRTRIGINVSEADLSRGDFARMMDDFVAGSVLEPENLVLEVTETMLLLDEAGRIRDLLHALDERGFTIALDDFGTGFSSLTHLRDFPIRKVKIDKDFIAALADGYQSRLIVQAMVQMARSLNIGMVAEGVETDEQLTFLKSIGCSHAQGYKFARALAVGDLRRLQPAFLQEIERPRASDRDAA